MAEEKKIDIEEEKSEKTDKKKARKYENEIAELETKLAEKEKALKEADEKYMRMFAEYDNFRKRSAKEKDGIYSDAVSDTVKNLLPTLDNLERAEAFSDPEKILEGLKMISKGYREALEKLGIKEIEALGKEFDPNLHNAVMHIEDEKYGESEIVEVLQKGYTIGDKVIRYAVVKVAN